MPTSTSVPPSLSQANQLSVDTLSSPIERTPDSQSPLIKKGLEPNKQRSAQRRKHVVEFHRQVFLFSEKNCFFRRIKGITARTKFSQCQLCSEIVSTNNADLTNHVYSHSKVNLFACLRCEASFRQKGELHNHIKLVHPNEACF
jgi:predicted DNA-binding ribbon-helix-helix protein